MSRYHVQVWRREGPRQPPTKPEVRVLFHSSEVEAEEYITAACRVADTLHLPPDSWGSLGKKSPPRPHYVLRVERVRG